MQSAIAILLPLIVKAAFNDDANAVSSAANALSGSVAAFSSGQSLVGALGIQGYFPTLTSAVNALAADAVTDADVNVDTIQSFATAVVNLLDALTAKSADFTAVGASTIVSGDIGSITSPAGKIVSNIVSALQEDCVKLNSLTNVVSSLEAAFSSAGAAYSAAAPSFPALTCSGGAASSSAPAASSSAPAAASSTAPAAASSSAPAKASSSAPAKSSAASSSKPSAINNGTGHANGTTTTVHQTAYVTIPCESTTLTYGGKTYTVSQKTTLTVSDCSCSDNAKVTKPAASSKPAATAPAAVSSPAKSAPHIANAGAKAAVAVPAAVAGAVFMML